jgi:hypothetical protein
MGNQMGNTGRSAPSQHVQQPSWNDARLHCSMLYVNASKTIAVKSEYFRL